MDPFIVSTHGDVPKDLFVVPAMDLPREKDEMKIV